MGKFRCKKCGRVIQAESEICCAPGSLCKERAPECCGQPMIEIIDD